MDFQLLRPYVYLFLNSARLLIFEGKEDFLGLVSLRARTRPEPLGSDSLLHSRYLGSSRNLSTPTTERQRRKLGNSKCSLGPAGKCLLMNLITCNISINLSNPIPHLKSKWQINSLAWLFESWLTLNPGLKVNRNLNVYCTSVFHCYCFLEFIITQIQNWSTKNINRKPQSYKTEINIYDNHGLIIMLCTTESGWRISFFSYSWGQNVFARK